MTAPSVVDMSGVVSSTLQQYRQVLVQYQQMVTGQPDTLRTAANTTASYAQQLRSLAGAVTSEASRLSSSWSGIASQAYQTAAGKLAGDLGSVAGTLDKEVTQLGADADALVTARGNLDKIIQWFDSNGATLTSSARQAASGSAGSFVTAAQQLGERAVALAKSVASWLGGVLAGPKTTGLTLWDESTRYQVDGQTFFGNGSLLQGNAYFQYGPKLTTSGGLDYDAAKGWSVDGKLNLNLLDTGASAKYTDGFNSLSGDAKLTVGADGKLQISRDGVDASVKAGAEATASITSTQQQGAVTTETKVDGKASAAISGKAEIDSSGVELSGKAGVTAEVNGSYSAEAYGIKAGVTGGVSTGAGGEVTGGVTYSNGHLKGDLSAGLTAVVGAKAGVNVDIDVPKVAGEVSSAATSLWNGTVSAVGAIGDSYAKAMAENPYAMGL